MQDYVFHLLKGLVMALRIRKTGEILCAAIHPERIGDVYIPDWLSYKLTVELGYIVTTPEPEHSTHGKWWFRHDDSKPDNCEMR